ncbi:GntR family transcriptional regulator [Alphaproteobacteria bacterium]|nr:GntR family transcriptional regulator [Alphaproteobacteria bacterium]
MLEKIVKLELSKPIKSKSERTRVGNQGSRADDVKERVVEAIRGGRYQPGERIRETEVADWLSVSRTPVREAFRRLESEGLLVFESWRGAIVADLNRQQISELYAMREVLEGAAARLAARHIDEAEIELLSMLLERSNRQDASAEKLAELNRQFHEAIYASAHNRYLSQTLEQLRNSLALLKGTTYSVPGRRETIAQEHQAILDAISARNPEAAEIAARAHIVAAQRARLRLLIEEELS